MELKKEVCLVFLLLFLCMPLISPVYAADPDPTIDEIKAPLDKIYSLVQGIVSIVAILVITGAGIMYMTSGNNLQSRDNAKHMLTYAVVGLALIWVAPSLVNFLTI